MAWDQQRKEEIAARLRELRGPRPQQVIADKVPVTVRAYQAWEAAESGMHWENLERLAEIHAVSVNFLLYGQETTPQDTDAQLDKIQAALSQVDEQVRLLRAETAARDAEVLKRLDEGLPPTRRSRRPPPR